MQTRVNPMTNSTKTGITKPTKGEAPSHWVVFNDLLGLAALFTGIFYVNGYVYTKVYYSQFYLSLDSIQWSLTSCIIAFIDQVILMDNWRLFLAIVLALFFAGVFYLARRSLSALSGYSLLCILIVALFAVSTNASSRAAKKAADRDWNSDKSNLPRVLAKPMNINLLDEPLARALQDKSLRLLYESKEYLYLVQTQSPLQASDLPVYVFPKSKLTMFEISRPKISE